MPGLYAHVRLAVSSSGSRLHCIRVALSIAVKALPDVVALSGHDINCALDKRIRVILIEARGDRDANKRRLSRRGTAYLSPN